MKLKKIEYKNGKKINETFHYKKEMHKLCLGNFKLSLSKELDDTKNSDTFSMDDVIIARIKHRFSCILPQFDKWRLDITLSKNIDVNKNLQQIKFYKEKILSENVIVTSQNFANLANFDDTSYEIEWELIADKIPDFLAQPKNVMEDEITEIINFTISKFSIKANIISTDSIISTNSSDTYQQKIYEIAKLIKMKNIVEKFKTEFGFKKLVNPVKEMTRNDYYNKIMPYLSYYYVTDKFDGFRSYFVIENGVCYLINKEITYLDKNLFKDFISKLGIRNNTMNVFDVELMELDGQNLIAVFDCFVFNSKNMVYDYFEERYNLIRKYEADPKSNILVKKMIRMTDDMERNKKEIDAMTKETLKRFHTDGLIFTSTYPVYEMGDRKISNPHYKPNKLMSFECWKWKPMDFMTIDFFIKLSNVTGKQTADKAIKLFCGIRREVMEGFNMHVKYTELFHNDPCDALSKDYLPIQFEPSNNPNIHNDVITKEELVKAGIDPNIDLDRRIGEFKYDINKKKFVIIKVREDRDVEVNRCTYYGNDYKFAELVWQNYTNPLHYEDLFKKPENNYFQADNNPIYVGLRKFNLAIKHKLYEEVRNLLNEELVTSNQCLDLAAGRGQDMYQIASLNFDLGVFVDYDLNALTEMTERRHAAFKQFHKMRLLTQQMNLNDDYKINVEKLNNLISNEETKNFSLISCQFALHYFLESKKSLINLINFIKTFIDDSGYFFCTFFDGSKILDMMSSVGVSTKHATEIPLISHHDEKNLSRDFIKEKTSSSTKEININNKQYHIKLLNDKQVDGFGQSIDVKLPFSGDAYYTEYICNIPAIIKTFEENNFTLVKTGSFKEFEDDSEILNKLREKHLRLTEYDKEFSSLYSYLILKH
jgi:hypothetical protein